MSELNQNQAPYPKELEDIVANLEYRPGWRFYLSHIDRGQGSEGLTLQILSQGYDTYHPDRGETYRVWHYFPVPPAAYNYQSWMRWVFDRLVEVETHETCEFLQVKGQRPFAPNHGPGWDPYSVRELNTTEAAETTFRGERRTGSQAGKEYPYEDGDVVVLGPEIFASDDSKMISWKGENYIKQGSLVRLPPYTGRTDS